MRRVLDLKISPGTRMACAKRGCRSDLCPVSPGRSIGSLDAALLPLASRRGFRACVIGIDEAMRGAARCRHVALGQRGITAFEIIVVPAGVDLQADRILRIVGL